ncbi:Elongation factor Ts [subsurface metagenome]|jgi:elongation factor Ts|nr:translation elongation factor Ts [Clostridia bacterium]TET16058.1 MAG: translation elongation factor Ts [Actinomycetota bacterium]
MEIKVELVKELREKSSAGMMDCKKALVESNGDIKKAEEILKEKGLAKASKKASRATKEGIIDSYIHTGSKIGVMVEVNCETDFVARNEMFKNFVHDIALHITAAAPLYVSKEDVPQEVLDKEKELYRKQALNEGKPEKIIDKIAEGKLKKYYEENCLLEQLFVKDNDVKIGDLLKQHIAKMGENIVIKRFERYILGEE